MGIKFQTDQSGANNNVCSGSSQIFNFSLARSATIDSADFVIKKGSGTTASIVVSIHNAVNGGGSVVESVTVLASNITQLFTTIAFIFSGNTTLTAGTSYSLVVSSTTSCVGSSPYSMKSGNFQVTDSGIILNTGYGIASDISNSTTLISSASLGSNISSNILSNTSVSANVSYSTTISSNINNIVSSISQANKISGNNNPNNRLRLDGKGNFPQLKLYLGNKKPIVYRGNSKILDQNS